LKHRETSGEGDILRAARRPTATVDSDKRLQTIDSTGIAGFRSPAPCYDRKLIFMQRST
jgi:hypothetical protein